MEFEPKQLVFRDIRLNQSYTLSLCITNPLQSPAEFNLRSSNSTRYTITPNHIKLQSKQSIVVTVRLFLNYYPNIQKGSNQGQEDSIQIKSTYFDQKIPVQFFLHSSKARSRSLSPRNTSSNNMIRMNNKERSNTNNDLLTDLNNQIKDRDNYIIELKDLISNLESKHPKWQEIINSKLKKEREIFDEKSNKILTIIAKKDEVIQSLEFQLSENMTVLQNRNQTLNNNQNIMINQQKEQIENLIKELNDHKNEILSITSINTDLKHELANKIATNKDLQVKESLLTNELSNEKNKSLIRFVPQQLQELRSLREQTIDQSEQIEILVSELNKLRLESKEYSNIHTDFNKANLEIKRLKDDILHQQQKYLELQYQKEELQKTYDQLRNEQILHNSQFTPVGDSNNNNNNNNNNIQRRSVSWQQQPPPSLNQSIYMDGRSYETQNIGSMNHQTNGISSASINDNDIATSTPMNFNLGGSHTQTIQEKNEMITLYQERLFRYENEFEVLKSQLNDHIKLEKDLQEKYSELVNRYENFDQDNKLLNERVNRLKNEKESLESILQTKEIDLQNVLAKVTNQNEMNDHLEAHVWWSYIWHALKQQQQQQAAIIDNVSNNNPVTIAYDSSLPTSQPMNTGNEGTIYPGNYDYISPHEAAQKTHEIRLRENLRSQAIEIANLRQEALARKLSTKREMDALKDQIENYQREILRIQTQSKLHKNDKDVKISELTATIRILSSRSDLHSQVVATRQEIETEKLTIHHLRADLDVYRLMLEEEQRKVLASRKEYANLQAQIDSTAVLQSVSNIPGVSAATLIEMMAGQISSLQTEANKSKVAHEDAINQVKSLQRAIALNQQQQRKTIEKEIQSEKLNKSIEVDIDKIRRSRSVSPSTSSIHRKRQSYSTNLPNNNNQETIRKSPYITSPIRTTNKYSLMRPLEEDFGPSNEMNQTEAIEIDDHGHIMNSPFSIRMDSNMNNLSIIVDAETTPKQVIESLDRSLLLQRVLEQESIINELNDQIKHIKEEKVNIEQNMLYEWDGTMEANRIEYENSQRKQDLLLTQVNELKSKLNTIQQRNIELEKTLSDNHADQLTNAPTATLHSTTNQDIITSLHHEIPHFYGSEMSSVSGMEVNYEENKKELEQTKILLRERTTQLKIIMQTMEALQMTGNIGIGSVAIKKCGIKYDAEDEELFKKQSSSSHFNRNNVEEQMLEDFQIPKTQSSLIDTAQNSNLISQALVKRVVELTTELTSQCSIASLEARKVEDLELANRRQIKEINKLKLELRTYEDNSAKVLLQVNAANNRLKEIGRQHIDEISILKHENENLLNNLRDCEALLDASELQCSTYVKQAEVTDQKDFMSWLEMITLENQNLIYSKIEKYDYSTSDSSHLPTSSSTDDLTSSSPVKDLVLNLITQWKEFVSTVPQFKPLSGNIVGGNSNTGITTKLSKSEQKFLQRITDLVMTSNDCAMNSRKELRFVQSKLKQYEHANQIAIERLKICASNLNRYRKRCHVFERVLGNDRKYELMKKGKLESLLKQSLSDLHQKYTITVDALRAEKRDRMIQEVKRALETQQNRKLQIQIAELEAKGSSTLRGRDEAMSSFESKLKSTEDSMHTWFRNELPRLVTGLPITEDSLSYLNMKNFNNENVNPNLILYPSSYSFGNSSDEINGTNIVREPNYISNQLLSSLGMDRTYALSQALCASQATQAIQLMRISGLTEINSILKERNVNLEGVLIRWRDQIIQAEINHSKQSGSDAMLSIEETFQNMKTSHNHSPNSGMIGAAYGSDHVIQQIYSYVENETKLNSKVKDLTNRVIELEEECIELKAKHEQATTRAIEMKSLVEVVMADEQVLKTKATQQLTKIRMDLEDQHANELRQVRQGYEKDKNMLVSELNSVAAAVEEAKLTSVDTKTWDQLVLNDQNTRNQIEREFDALEHGIIPNIDNDPLKYNVTPPYKTVARKKKINVNKHKKSKLDASSSVGSTKSSSSPSSNSSNDDSEDGEDSSSNSDDDANYPKKKKSNKSHAKKEKSADDIEKIQNELRQSRDEFNHYLQQVQHREQEEERGRSNTNNNDVVDHTIANQLQRISDGIEALQRFSTNPISKSKRNLDYSKRGSNRYQTTHDDQVKPSINAVIASPSTLNSSGISSTGTAPQQGLAEVQMENLERALELERRKHEETKFEVNELEQMLQVQQQAFKQLLDKEHKENISKQQQQSGKPYAEATSSIIDSLSDPSQSPPDYKQTANKKDHDLKHVLNNVENEDRALWPSLNNLLNELLNVLNDLSLSGQHNNSSLIKAAISMAARVKVVCCSKGPSTHSSTSSSASNPIISMDNILGTTVPKSTSLHDPDMQYATDGQSIASINLGTIANFGNYINHQLDSSDLSSHHTHLIKTIIERIKFIESSFADDHVTERHLYMMRDLRMRLQESEKHITSSIATQYQQWSDEKAQLLHQAQANADLAEQMKKAQLEHIQTLKQRYETALKNVEDSLESTTNAAKAEISRLKLLLQQQQQQQTENNNYNTSITMNNPNGSPNRLNRRNTVSNINNNNNRRSNSLSPQPLTAATKRTSLQSSSIPMFPITQIPQNTNASKTTGTASKVPSEEFYRMQKIMNLTSDELETCRLQLQQNEANHKKEVFELKQQLIRLRHAHHEVVDSLEKQILDHAFAPAVMSQESLDSEDNNVENVKDQLRTLDYKYKLKCIEIDAILRSMATENILVHDEDGMVIPDLKITSIQPLVPPSQQQQKIGENKTIDHTDNQNSNPNNQDVDNSGTLSPATREALIVASKYTRHSLPPSFGKSVTSTINNPHRNTRSTSVVTFQDVDNNNVRNANNNSSVLSNLFPFPAQEYDINKQNIHQDYNKKDPFSDFTLDYAIPEDIGKEEKTKLLVRRMNEMRRTSKLEINQLKATINNLQGNIPIQDENMKLKQVVSELKSQITLLKEDNLRKNKLHTVLKTAKTADENSLEQWKNEVHQLEENCKRLQRALASKDALVKDLKAKLEDITNPSPEKEHGNTISNLSNDVANLSAAELRTRLRTSELERARNRTRIQALKDKILEIENQHNFLIEENTKLVKANEKVESLKSSILRKDHMIQTLKSQIEKLHEQIEVYKTSEIQIQTEAEKKIKQLQRQVDLATRTQHELEQESILMRQRLTDSSIEQQYHHYTAGNPASSRSGDSGGILPQSDQAIPLRSTFTNMKHPQQSMTKRSNTHINQTSSSSNNNSNNNNINATENRRTNTINNANNSNNTQMNRRHTTFNTDYQSNVTNDPIPPIPLQLNGIPTPLVQSNGNIQEDLQDVITALGVNPSNLGLSIQHSNHHPYPNPNLRTTSNNNDNMNNRYRTNISPPTATSNRHNQQPQQQQQQQNISILSSTISSTSSPEGTISSVERRLQNLVNSALESPIRLRKL